MCGTFIFLLFFIINIFLFGLDDACTTKKHFLSHTKAIRRLVFWLMYHYIFTIIIKLKSKKCKSYKKLINNIKTIEQTFPFYVLYKHNICFYAARLISFCFCHRKIFVLKKDIKKEIKRLYTWIGLFDYFDVQLIGDEVRWITDVFGKLINYAYWYGILNGIV